jgi:hypothetical protein
MILKTVETVIGHWVTFIKAHEKLLLALIAAFTLIHFADKAYDAYGSHLKAITIADNAHIAQIEQNNAKLEADLIVLKATVDARAKIDDAKIAAAKQKLIVVQKVDAALPLPELSKHWESLLALPTESITPQSNGTVAVTTDAAHTTVARLEEVNSLEDQLSSTNDKFKGCTDVRAKQDVQITGLKDDITAEKKGRADDAKQAKQDIHHAYWRGFKHGAVVTIIAAVGIKLATVIR